MEALLKFAYLVDDYNEIIKDINRLKKKEKRQGFLNEDDIERIEKYVNEKRRGYHRISGAKIILQITYSKQTLNYIEAHAEALLIANFHKKHRGIF